MANLYEIDKEIMNCVDEETGEIIDFDKLSELQMRFDEKVENIGCCIKNLLAEAKMLKEEKDNLSKRQKVCENKAGSLKQYLSDILDGQKFKTTKVSISYRKSEAVNIYGPDLVPEKYLKYAPSINKAEAKRDIKAGKIIPGISLETKQNIQIK